MDTHHRGSSSRNSKQGQTRNMTINLAAGLLGFHADVVCGASNTQNYLRWIYGVHFDRTTFISAGYTVIVVNCATHRNI